VLNAADEVLTGMFLDGKVDFPTITRTVARVVREHVTSRIHSVDDVIRADRRARAAALAAANGANPEVS
jgi:1-deoxy-D-xylulose 5-phosphate reductoisomerase